MEGTEREENEPEGNIGDGNGVQLVELCSLLWMRFFAQHFHQLLRSLTGSGRI